ncbi:MAG: hypothetical protein ACI37T_04045 [Candidatus Gastranaerophilaceae bacterium]
MILRVLLLFLSFMILVNLIIVTLCYVTNQNIYAKYGKEILIGFGVFIMLVTALYIALALIGLK